MHVYTLLTGPGVWTNTTVQSGKTTARGKDIGAFFLFGIAEERETFEMPIAISFLSMDQVCCGLLASLKKPESERKDV